jgi:hypothetical protein
MQKGLITLGLGLIGAGISYLLVQRISPVPKEILVPVTGHAEDVTHSLERARKHLQKVST